MSWFDSEDGPGEADRNVQLPVSRRSQETEMWCWAASGQMVMEYQGTRVEQCDQANNRFGMNDCCQSPVPTTCVQGGWPEFDKYGFSFNRTTNSPLSWSQILQQIDTHRIPFAITWAWEGGGGHMMVVFGYAVIGGGRYVHIHDPLPVNQGSTRMITYDAYVSKVPDYTHWNDYYDVVRSFTPGGPADMEEDVPGQAAALSAAQKEAQGALPVLRSFLKLDTPGSAPDSMTLGKGISVSTLRLGELQAAQAPGPGAAPEALAILDRVPTKVVYPVLAAGQSVQAEVEVSQSGKTWRQSGFGSPVLTIQIKKTQVGPGAGDKTAAVIAVPALNQQFLVERAGDSKVYVTLFDGPVTGFTVGERLSPSVLLDRLISAAKKHDGLPR